MTHATPRPLMYICFGKKRYEVVSVEDAATKWNAFRDASYAGVSDIGNGVIVRDSNGKHIARISYNGRIWA